MGTCSISGCDRDIGSNYVFCSTHKCKITNCDNAKKGDYFCPNHTCKKCGGQTTHGKDCEDCR